jgi:erythromycin esterase
MPVIRAYRCVVLLLAAACASDPAGPNDPVGVPGAPEGWRIGGIGNPGTYGTTTDDKHGGNLAFYFTGPAAPAPINNNTFVSISQNIRVEAYRGRRARFSAWVKPRNVTDAQLSGLYMRVDGPRGSVSFDNMFERPVSGSSDWQQVAVVLDVPPIALGIQIGLLFNARNTLLVDDLKLEVVGTDVPVTKPSAPSTTTLDSASIAASYARSPATPANLDFEGVPGPSTATVDWLSRTASALTTTDPAASLDDLEPLRQMIGSAHVVGLGEGTHGTREFFQMKHRILKFLVTRMGFTHFAIEATSPEADDMNRYVLTGAGDPARLLSRLYFWTWNTQEVAEMIRWMREWNTTAPANQRVQFLGFDMQSPGASIDSVISYFGAVDLTAQANVVTKYSCIARYRNNGATYVSSPTGYALLTEPARQLCAASLKEVHDSLTARRAAYVAASSADKFEASLHHARLVQQFEAMVSSSSTGSRARDAAMAENVQWIRDRAGATARIVLWAHNGHIQASTGLMGGHLRAAYGADYRTLGFAFGQGTLTAVGQTGSTFTTLGSWTASIIPNSSIEAVFEATKKPRLLLDTRTVAAGGAAAAPLAGPILMRSVGSVFNQALETAYFGTFAFPNDFDLLIYLSRTNASARLPFNY